MAIASNLTTGPYTANGTQTAFAFDFTIVSGADVQVQIGGVVQSSNLYTVAVNAGGTGTVTFSVAPTSGSAVLLVSAPDFAQETVFEVEGAYTLDQVNTTNRRDAVRTNWLAGLVRRIMPAGWETSSNRVGKFLAWDAGGNPVYSSGTGADAGLRSDLATNGGVLIKLGSGLTAEAADRGAASLAARTAQTAAQFELLANTYTVLTGYAGATHLVETSPLISKAGFRLDLNGSTLRNTNATPISTNDQLQIVMFLGFTNFISDNALTFYTAVSTVGCTMTLGAGAGANFAVGDLVFVRGASFYLSGGFQVATYQTRARIEAVAGDVVTLDRGLTLGLAGDTPKIGNFKEGVSCGLAGITVNAYLWYAPVIENGTLKSDLGLVMAGGGVIDGKFLNITAIGRNGWSLNAAQDCLVDGLRFQSWRKICELAQGSSGTTIRNVRGTLGDASTKFGGASDVGPFGLSISENCADCLFDDFVVSSGPNNFGAVNAGALLGSGRHNRMKRSQFSFPALTGYGLVIQSNPTVGNPCDDSGYEDIIVSLPVGNRFINVGDAGGGLNRPFLRRIKCFGTVSSGRAASIMGVDGIMEDCWFEAGFLFRSGTLTGWTIRDNWIPGGFDPTFTLATFAANKIYNNDSTANRAANGAALRFATNSSITTLVANTIWQSATFPAGSLAVGDTIIVGADTTAAGAGANARNVRVSVFDGTTTQSVGSKTVTANGSLGIRSSLTILSDTLVRFDTMISGSGTASTVTVASIAANGLKVNVEAWVANAADNIFAGYCEILPRKNGMIQLPSMAA